MSDSFERPVAPHLADTARPPIEYPALYQAASQSSRRGQQLFKLLTWIELGLVVLGAGAAAVASLSIMSERLVALLAGTAFLLAIVTRLSARARQDDSAWFDGRAVAETVKSQTWRFVMRATPFDQDSTADRAFAEHLGRTLRARAGLRILADVVPERGQITGQMRAVRNLPIIQRRDLYVAGRIRDQVDWYCRSARRHRRMSARWSILAITSEGLAILTAAVAVANESLALLDLFGVFGALAAALTALNQLGRHEESARAYSLACQELLTIASLAESVRTEDDLAVLVQDAEGAISREHTMWMAKRAEPLGG